MILALLPETADVSDQRPLFPYVSLLCAKSLLYISLWTGSPKLTYVLFFKMPESGVLELPDERSDCVLEGEC